MVSGVDKSVGTFLRQLIRLYQIVLSPWVGRQCRFHPSCSVYAAEAILEHGAWRGCYLTVRRVFRCNPWFEGGFDPVPSSAKPRTTVLNPPENRGQSCCPPK